MASTKRDRSVPMRASGELRSFFRRWYRDADGFDISRGEEQIVRRARSDAMYGEIMPAAGVHLLRSLGLGPHDVFFDLGCGLGKVVLTAAITTPARRCVGVELAHGRVVAARRALRRAQADGVVAAGRVRFREQDIQRVDLRDMTVAYACSTAFPLRFMRSLMERLSTLRRPVTFASTQVLDDHKAFTQREVLRLDMTWRRRAKVYVYDVDGR